MIGKWTVASEKGQRRYQEDRCVAFDTSAGAEVLAVLDGHCGSMTAEFCKHHIEKIFKDSLDLLKDEKRALELTVLELARRTLDFDEGSTISMVCIPNGFDIAHVAILGDSPVIIRSRGGAINVSPEHNVQTNVAEREAAIKRGGIYSDGYIWDDRFDYGLQLSRALGDVHLDKILNREPELYSVDLDYESFIIVASDGVVDPEHGDSKEQIAILAAMVEKGAVAQDLVNDALNRETKDNVTAIVWRPQ